MEIVLIVLSSLIALVALLLLFSYFCYYITFYQRKTNPSSDFTLPPGNEYLPFKDLLKGWSDDVKKLPYKEFTVKSFDNLTLYAKYYEFKEGAPIELMLHGYRGSADRDLCGGVKRCQSLNRNALIVDLRASGKSEGKTITFGINESKDCLVWIDFIIKTFGQDVKIILTGVSMGAATVLITAGKQLPKNVIGVIADSGYTSAKDIIKCFMKSHHLPPNLLYPFVKLGAKVFGRFDLEETSSYESMKSATIPILFIHGNADDFVPCFMSEQNFAACSSNKKFFKVEGAGHVLAYMFDSEGYIKAINEFDSEVLKIN